MKKKLLVTGLSVLMAVESAFVPVYAQEIEQPAAINETEIAEVNLETDELQAEETFTDDEPKAISLDELADDVVVSETAKQLEAEDALFLAYDTDQKQLNITFEHFADEASDYHYAIYDGDTCLKEADMKVELQSLIYPAYADFNVEWTDTLKEADRIVIEDKVTKDWIEGFIDLDMQLSGLKAERTKEGFDVQWGTISDCTGYAVLVWNKDNQLVKHDFTSDNKLDVANEDQTVQIIPYKKVVSEEDTDIYYGTLSLQAVTEDTFYAPTVSVLNEACQYRLSWDEIPAAEGYEVRIYNSENDTFELYQTVKETELVISGVEGNKDYEIQVCAIRTVDGKTEVEASEVVTAHPVMEIPANIENLQAVPGEHVINLSWNAVDGVDGYYVYTMNPSTKKFEQTGKTNDIKYAVKGLAAGTQTVGVVGYKVVNGYETVSAAMTSVSAVVTKIVPAKVSNLVVKNGECMLTLTWSKVNHATHYEILLYNATTKKWSKVGETSSLTYAYKGIKGNMDYKLAVKACRKINDYTEKGAQSSTVTGRPTMKTLGKVKDLKATKKEHAVQLKWDAVKNATGYEIYSYNKSTGKKQKIATTASTKYLVQNLKSGVNYSYVVYAIRVKNNYTVRSSSRSSIVTAKPYGYSVEKLEGLVAKKGEHSITLDWYNSSKALKYEIYSVDTATNKKTLIATTEDTKYTVKGLEKNVKYSYVVTPVRTVNKYRTVGKTSPVVSATPYEITPKQVTDLKAKAGDMEITLSWTKAKDAKEYYLYKIDQETGEASYFASTTNNSYTVKKLTNGEKYAYAVKSGRVTYGFKTVSAISGTVSAVPVIGKPKKPTSLNVTNSDAGNVLTWKAGSVSDGYYIYKFNYSTEKYEQIATTTELTYKDTKGVTTKGQYKYMVKAYRTEDNKKFYVSDEGITKLIFGATDVKRLNDKIHPIYYSAKVTRKAGLYQNVTIKTKKGTVASGTKVKVIYRQWKRSKVRLPNGQEGYISNNDLYVYSQHYTKSDYSTAEKEMFVNMKGYSSPSKYLIWINTYTQQINIFKGSKGNWDLVRTDDVCTGKLTNFTPLGTFDLWAKQRIYRYTSSYYEYLSKFRNKNAIHCRTRYNSGAVIDSRIGMPISLGCVRAKDPTAKYVYNNVPLKSTVVVH